MSAPGAIFSENAAGPLAEALLLAIAAAVYAIARFRPRPEQPLVRSDVFPSADADTDAPSADQVLFDSAQRLIDAQVSSNDVLDGRIAAAFGIGNTVLPVTIGILNLLQDGEDLPNVTRWLTGAALVAYAILIVTAGASFWIRNMDFRPNIEELRSNTVEGFGGAQLRR